MTVISDFFRRHHSVPATDVVVSWQQASEAVLLDWFGQYAGVVRCGWNRDANRDATVAERRAAIPLYEDIVAEIRRRACVSDPSPEIAAAAVRAALPVTQTGTTE